MSFGVIRRGTSCKEEVDEGTNKRTTVVVVVLSWRVSCVVDEGPGGPASKRSALGLQVLVLQEAKDSLQILGATASPGVIKSDGLVGQVDTHEDPVNLFHIHREEEEALRKNVHIAAA